MKKCVICKSIFPKEVETVWKYTCHRAKCESRLKIKRKNARNNVRRRVKLDSIV